MTKCQLLDTLNGNKAAMERLEYILNHTETSEDGETVFAAIEDAAEVYAILFTAWSGGADALADLDRCNMDAEKHQMIANAELVCITEQDAESFTTQAVKLEGEILIAADLV